MLCFGIAGALHGVGPQNRLVDHIALWVLVVVFVVVFLRVSVLRTEYSPAGIEVHRMLGTTRLTWEEISSFSLGYQGVVAHTTNGRDHVCGPGKSNWSRWARWRTRADETLDVLSSELALHSMR